MKAREKPIGMKRRIHESNKREERIGIAVLVAILIVIISVSVFLVNSMLNQSSPSQTVSHISELKAAIVDQLSLTFPNQTFIQTAISTLRQAGYTVDYYSGGKVTVGFYRHLPAHNYGVVILRAHSAAAVLEGKGYVEAPVSLFTSENYSRSSYVSEQLDDQLLIASYTSPQPPYYFAVTPKFVTMSMVGRFRNTTIIMMGCEGLSNTRMAEAFIGKGAKIFISWNKSVLASQTDQATTHLLRHLLIEKHTMKEAVEETNKEVGPDPCYDSLLVYHPLEAGNCTVQSVVSNFALGAMEIQHGRAFGKIPNHK
jgi:cell division protein FtsB